MTAQTTAVGTTPTVAELLIGALMHSSVTEVRSVLRFVEDRDMDEPAASVLATVRALALRGTPPGPQLVLDDLKRRGKLTRTTGVWLSSAMTSGACASAAPVYASAVVSEAFRSTAESLGHALISVSDVASEAELGALVEQAVAGIRGIGARLNELRGDA